MAFKMGSERKIRIGEFRRMLLDENKQLLLNVKQNAETAAGDGFIRRDPTLVIRHNTAQELFERLLILGADIKARFPDLAPTVEGAIALANATMTGKTGQDHLDVYTRLMDLHRIPLDAPGISDNFILRASADAVHIAAYDVGDDEEGMPAGVRLEDQRDQDHLAATANMIAEVRRAGRPFTRDERGAIALAYRLLDGGVQLPPGYRSIGVYGFREHQTFLSLANPGDGHLSVTCTRTDLLSGTIVHIEHIDRDDEDDREILEPYRLPATVNAARVRLHTGAAAPCTAFIGRPVFENGVVIDTSGLLKPNRFENDLLKSVHLTASASTAMFMNGVADCKIAIERMSALQAIRFMLAVNGNVVRDPARQYLSAAFNINLSVHDDRGNSTLLVKDRLSVARLAIELAVAGRFDKVTWDGATNVRPSIPIIEQLTSAQWVELVHTAHEQGLETYMSSGLSPGHMRACTHVGVDGVGIGTSLHYRDERTKAIGQLKAEAVYETLRVRNLAEQEPLGRGARLLARMDRLFFEGTLPTDLDPARKDLFEQLRAQDERAVERSVGAIGPLDHFSGAGHPAIQQAMRMLKTRGYASIGAARDHGWNELVEEVGERLKDNDLIGLQELLP